MVNEIVFYAPNVHSGGGFVLLQALLSSLPLDIKIRFILDSRVRGRIGLSSSADIYWVHPQVFSRFSGEIYLKSIAAKHSIIFCFHGLPPLIPINGNIIVFLQNRIYLGGVSINNFPLKVKCRIFFEKIIGRFFRFRVSEYIVQTPSMKGALLEWFGCKERSPSVRVLPFMNACFDFSSAVNAENQKKWDFVYIADGSAHKNHRRLIDAWRLLAENNLYPSLALTLGDADQLLIDELWKIINKYDLRINNLNSLTTEEVRDLYENVEALIFPSLGESFGLPLVEARKMGVKILAPEMDYVRDVCVPLQTFDPNSARSIARAVERFYSVPPSVFEPFTPEEFWVQLYGNSKK